MTGAMSRRKGKSTWIERFWARVDKSGDCWEWTGYIGSHGYGEHYRPGNIPVPISGGGRKVFAHRASWDHDPAFVASRLALLYGHVL